MAIYTFRHTETEEVRDFHIKMSELDEETARLNQEGWERVFMAPRINWGGTGTLGKLDGEYNDRLKEIKKYGGKTATVETK